jgi:hypothetical protein
MTKIGILSLAFAGATLVVASPSMAQVTYPIEPIAPTPPPGRTHVDSNVPLHTFSPNDYPPSVAPPQSPPRPGAHRPLPDSADADIDTSGPRFRGGIGLEFGALFAPHNPQGLPILDLFATQLGVQINDHWAVYTTPSAGFSTVGSVHLRAAILGECTLAHSFSIGAGPDVEGVTSVVFPFSGSSSSASSATLFGGDLHLALSPLHAWGRNGQRHALALSFDMRLLTSKLGLAYMPVAGISYQAF